MTFLFGVLTILWHSALVIIPYAVSRWAVQNEVKKQEQKLTVKARIKIYGECILTAIILTALLFGKSEEDSATLKYKEIIPSFVVLLISASMGAFLSINKHNKSIKNSL